MSILIRCMMVSMSAASVALAQPDDGQPGRPTARMQELLDEHAALHPKPIETLTPQEARKQPTLGDAAKAWLKKHKGEAPKQPEKVGDVDNTKYDSPGGKQHVRLYKPGNYKDAQKANVALPVIVYFHGGGFVIADIDTYDASCRELCNATGAIVASAEYRHAPEHPFPAAAEDAVAAYGWVCGHAKEYGGDPTRVAVAGESAGGNLAAVVSLTAREKGLRMPTHQLLVYPVTQDSLDTPSERMYAGAKPLNKPMMQWFFGHYGQQAPEKAKERTNDAPPPPPPASPTASAPPATDWRMVPLKASSHAGLPPATIILAEIDPIASDGEMYAEKLRAAGVSVRVRKFSGVTHEFFGLGAVLPEAREAVEFAAEGLKMTGGEMPAAWPASNSRPATDTP